MEPLKVLQYGVGPIGASIVKVLSARPQVQIVGGVDVDPEKVGRDLGEIAGTQKLGVRVSKDAKATLTEYKPDVVVHCTGSYLKAVAPQLLECIDAGASVVSTTEELAYPFEKFPELAEEIDSKARAKGVAVLGTGINPGFVMDTLVLVLSDVCQSVNAIRAERVVDAARRRLPLQTKVGAGLSVEEFNKRVTEGTIRHVGLSESVSLIASAIGWKLGEIQERITPVVAEAQVQTDYVKVEKGKVAGIRQVAKGLLAGQEVIVLDLRMYVSAKDPHDSILIDGVPPIDMIIRGGLHGDEATAGIVANAVMAITGVTPGLRLMSELPPFPPRMGLAERRSHTTLRKF